MSGELMDSFDFTTAQVGTLVYGHLLATPPFSEPEISCVDPSTQKASGFGELQGGFLIRHVELGRCRACVYAFALSPQRSDPD